MGNPGLPPGFSPPSAETSPQRPLPAPDDCLATREVAAYGLSPRDTAVTAGKPSPELSVATVQPFGRGVTPIHRRVPDAVRFSGRYVLQLYRQEDGLYRLAEVLFAPDGLTVSERRFIDLPESWGPMEAKVTDEVVERFSW